MNSMNGEELIFRAVTPLLVGDWCGKARCSRGGGSGSTSMGSGGLRVSEIRASSRELFRNAAYQLLGDWKEVLKKEMLLFGSVDIASPFKIRVQMKEKDGTFHSEWKSAYGMFIHKVRSRCGKRGKTVTRMFIHLENKHYDNYVLEGTRFSVILVPRPLILRRVSKELGSDEESIFELYRMSITHSLELLGVGKRRSRGMGRLVHLDTNRNHITEGSLLNEYLSLLKEVLGERATSPREPGLRVKVLDETDDRSEVLFIIYACAKRCMVAKIKAKGRDCSRNCFLLVTENGHSHLVGLLQNFHLFRRPQRSGSHP